MSRRKINAKRLSSAILRRLEGRRQLCSRRLRGDATGHM